MSPQADNDLRGKFLPDWAQYEAEPEQDLWPGIEAEVAPPSRRFPAWYWVAAAALALLILGWGWARWTTAPAPSQVAQQPETALPPALPVPPSSPQRPFAAQPKPEPAIEAAPAPKRQSARPLAQPLAEAQVPAAPEPTVTVAPLSPPEPKVVTATPKPAQALAVAPPSAARPEPAATTPPKTVKPLPQTRSKQRIDLNDFSLEEALATASETLNKRIGEPVRVEKETETKREVRTVEVGFLNLKITHKRYRDESL